MLSDCKSSLYQYTPWDSNALPAKRRRICKFLVRSDLNVAHLTNDRIYIQSGALRVSRIHRGMILVYDEWFVDRCSWI